MTPHEECEPGPEVAVRAFERMLAGPVDADVLAEAILAASRGCAGSWEPPAPSRMTDRLLRDRE